MYRLRKYAEKRKELVTALAERIADAARIVDLPPGEAIPHFDYIPSVFDEQQSIVRNGVVIVPLVKGRMSAIPYADGSSLLSIVQTACGEAAPWREMEQDGGLGERLRQAREASEAIVVITDLSTIRDPLYGRVVSTVSSAIGDHAVVLLLREPAGSAEDAQVDITMRSAFQAALANGALVEFSTIRSADDLKRRLADSSTRLRHELVSGTAPRKAEDPVIAADAAAQGVPIDSLTVLAGPGPSTP